MIVVAQVSFPRESINQASKTFIDLEDLPAEIIKTGPFFNAESDQVRVITMYHFTTDDRAENIKFVQDRYKPFKGIVGFSSDIDGWRSFETAIGRFRS